MREPDWKVFDRCANVEFLAVLSPKQGHHLETSQRDAAGKRGAERDQRDAGPRLPAEITLSKPLGDEGFFLWPARMTGQAFEEYQHDNPSI